MAEQQNEKLHNIPEWWMEMVRAAPPDTWVGIMAFAREVLQSVAIAYVQQVREAREAWCKTRPIGRAAMESMPPLLTCGEMRLDDDKLLLVDAGWFCPPRGPAFDPANRDIQGKELTDDEVVRMIMKAQVVWLPQMWQRQLDAVKLETSSTVTPK